ncbi:MAG: UDP-2,3-diacylglucosamine diphosphatase [Muribaculaceae bacterium]|nr:UDP-2,3-diacylglucosamine diphosphatase [Muribaculaceae bacterium]
MERRKTYFLSDLHLGAPYMKDSRESERRIVAFLDSIKDEAEAIYLLGDILDYWYEYRYVVPRGYVRFFGKLAELSDSGVKIVWLKGNHDIWIYDYLPQELGIEVIDGSLIREIYGKKVFLNHGDGVGKQAPTFRLIRSMFRNRFCQWMFAGIHPRWTVPFAYNWSAHSRKGGEERGIPDEDLLKNLKNFVAEYHKEHPDTDYFIFGHVHILSREEISDGCEMIVLGEWIRTFSYAVMTSKGLTLHKFSN